MKLSSVVSLSIGPVVVTIPEMELMVKKPSSFPERIV